MEAIVYAGANVTFTCSHPENVTIVWDFYGSSRLRSYEVTYAASISNVTLKPIYLSKMTIYGATRYMSGELSCRVEGSNSKAVGFLIVNGNMSYQYHFEHSILFIIIVFKCNLFPVCTSDTSTHYVARERHAVLEPDPD